MHQQRENLDIIFRRTIPEAVLEDYRSGRSLFGNPFVLKDVNEYSEKAYEHFSRLNLQEYSPDEVQIRHAALNASIEGKSVFYILQEYANQILVEKEGFPVCRIDQSLNWNSITLRLGQDIFTTSWMAWRDVQSGLYSYKGKNLSWPAVIETDDYKLNSILKKGLAENHSHLHGSTQSFPLSWACLMNHPDHIKYFLDQSGNFNENLSLNISRGTRDNVLTWDERLLYAAMIRALLFEKCITNSDKTIETFSKFDLFKSLSMVKKKTEALRFAYGEKFKQPDYSRKCLDYAICRTCYQVNQADYNRLLAGERNFLYRCFCLQFTGEFTKSESILFYLYLVIKSNFRSELIQNNKRSGFSNFVAFQDRKNQFFGAFNEYRVEAQRLAVCAGIEENNIISFETRIMPRESSFDMNKEIVALDKMVGFADKEKVKQFYYVIHFPKSKFTEKEFNTKSKFTEKEFDTKSNLLIPRNVKTRKGSKIKALALGNYLNKYDINSRRVWGIDACSNEIGCRPETFATEFRYLRGCIERKPRKYWYVDEVKMHPELGITYHVGEDFLDIIDGLRAIDEVLRFLPMEKGDRLGHALALGIEPKDYYEYKRSSIYLTKQDYLDNLIWILHRSLDMNVKIELNKRAWMTEKAGELIHEIYQPKIACRKQAENILDLYYNSWRLRGDHPDLYKSGKYLEATGKNWFPYRRYMQTDNTLDKYRNDDAVSELYYLYHFDSDVKKKGCEPVGIEVESWWIEMTEEIQRAMRIEVYKRGIAIESNPTSNVLIGTFKRYDKHPITIFNNHHLVRDDEPNMFVSVNTDDLGVFDTSLKNEYALLFSSIAESRHAEKNYEDDDIYEYLDYLRQNGIDMAFRKIKDGESDRTLT